MSIKPSPQNGSINTATRTRFSIRSKKATAILALIAVILVSIFGAIFSLFTAKPISVSALTSSDKQTIRDYSVTFSAPETTSEGAVIDNHYTYGDNLNDRKVWLAKNEDLSRSLVYWTVDYDSRSLAFTSWNYTLYENPNNDSLSSITNISSYTKVANSNLSNGLPINVGNYIMQIDVSVELNRGFLQQTPRGNFTVYAKFRVAPLEASFGWLEYGEAEEYEYNGENQMRYVRSINQPNGDDKQYVYDYEILENGVKVGTATYNVSTDSYDLSGFTSGGKARDFKNVGSYRTVVSKIYYLSGSTKVESTNIVLSSNYEKYSTSYNIKKRDLIVELSSIDLSRFGAYSEGAEFYSNSGNYIINKNFHNKIYLPVTGGGTMLFFNVIPGGSVTVTGDYADSDTSPNIKITGGLTGEPFVARMVIKTTDNFVFSSTSLDDPPVTGSYPHTLSVNLGVATGSSFNPNNYDTQFVDKNGNSISLYLIVNAAKLTLDADHLNVTAYSAAYDEATHAVITLSDDSNNPTTFRKALGENISVTDVLVEDYYISTTDATLTDNEATWEGLQSQITHSIPSIINANTYYIHIRLFVDGYDAVYLHYTATITQATNSLDGSFNFANGKAQQITSNINAEPVIADADAAWTYGRYSSSHTEGYDETGDHAVTAPRSNFKLNSTYSISLYIYDSGWRAVDTSVPGLTGISTTESSALREKIQSLFTSTTMNAGKYRLTISQTGNANFSSIEGVHYVFLVKPKQVTLAINPCSVVYGTSLEDAAKNFTVTATGLVRPVLNGEMDTEANLGLTFNYTVTYGAGISYAAGAKNGSVGVDYTINATTVGTPKNYVVSGAITPARMDVTPLEVSIIISPQENFFGLNGGDENPKQLTSSLVSGSKTFLSSDLNGLGFGQGIFYLSTEAILIKSGGSGYLTSEINVNDPSYTFDTNKQGQYLITLEYKTIPDSNAGADVLFSNNYVINHNEPHYIIKSAIFNMRWGTLKTLDEDGKIIDATSQVYTGRPYFYMPTLVGFESIGFTVYYYPTAVYNAAVAADNLASLTAAEAVLPIGEGQYTALATLTGGESNNFSSGAAANDFIITASSVTLTADNATVVYGNAAPGFTAKATFSNIGSLAIETTGSANSYYLNYTVYSADAAFDGKDKNDVAVMSSTHPNYGAMYSLIADSFNGYATNKVITLGTISLSTTYTTTDSALTSKDITLSYAPADGYKSGGNQLNVSVTRYNGTLSVTKREVTATFNTNPEPYTVYDKTDKGDVLNAAFVAEPAKFVTISEPGLVNGSDITDLVNLVFTSSSVNAGNATFVASLNASEPDLQNYTITIQYTGGATNAVYVIRPMPVTIGFKAASYSVTYGDDLDITDFYTISPLAVGDEDLAVSIGQLLEWTSGYTISGGYTAWATNVGTNAGDLGIRFKQIVVDGAPVSPNVRFPNYTFNIDNGTTGNYIIVDTDSARIAADLVVTPRAITATAQNGVFVGLTTAVPATITFDEGIPSDYIPTYSLVYAGTGYDNTTVSGATAPKRAGVYEVTITLTGALAGNYTLTNTDNKASYTLEKQKISNSIAWAKDPMNIYDAGEDYKNTINFNHTLIDYVFVADQTGLSYSARALDDNQGAEVTVDSTQGAIYTITLTILDKNNYMWSDGVTTDLNISFTTTTKSADIKISVEGWTYLATAKTPVVNEVKVGASELAVTDGTATWAYAYVEVGSANYSAINALVGQASQSSFAYALAFTDTVPQNAGLYVLRGKFVVADGTENNGAVGYAYYVFRIAKATVVAPTLIDGTNRVNTVTEYYKPTGNSVGIDVAENTAELMNVSTSATISENVITTNPASAVGTYTVTYTLKDTTNYEWATAANTDPVVLTYVVQKATATVTITLQDDLADAKVTYAKNNAYTSGIGATASVGDSALTATIKYTYTGTTVGGSSYNSSVAPVAAGNYTVTASVDETVNYSCTPDSKDFEIEKADLTVTVTASLTYGQLFSAATIDYTYTGFATGDTAANSITGTAEYKLDAAAIVADKYYTVKDGGYALTVSGLSSDNYNLIYNTAGSKLTVAKKSITLIANTISRYFLQDLGLPVKLTDDITGIITIPTGTFVKEDDKAEITAITWLIDGSSVSGNYNQGTHTVTASHADTANYTVTINTGSLVINRLPVTISISAASKVYDGTAATITWSVTSLASAVTDAVLSAYLNGTGSPVQIYHDDVLTDTLPVTAGAHNVRVDLGNNFTPNTLTSLYTISTLYLDATCINDIPSQTYNHDNPLTPEVTHTDGITDAHWSYVTVTVKKDDVVYNDTNKIKNVGTYSVEFTIDNPNVKWASQAEKITKQFLVTPFQLDVNQITIDDVVYTGEAIIPTVKLNGIDEYADNYFTVTTPENVKDCATYTVSLTIKDNNPNVEWANFTGVEYKKSFKVTRAEIYIAYSKLDSTASSATPYEVVWDGSAHYSSVSFYTDSALIVPVSGKLADELKGMVKYYKGETLVDDGTTISDAGVYTVKVVGLATNYKLMAGSAEQTFTVNKLLLDDSLITVSQTYYTGAEQLSSKFTACTIAEAYNAYYTISNVNGKEAGTYRFTATIKGAHKNNVGWQYTNGLNDTLNYDFVINEVTLDFKKITIAEVTYTGSDITATISYDTGFAKAKVDGVDKDVSAEVFATFLTISGNVRKAAGTHSVTFSIGNHTGSVYWFHNHYITDVTKDFVINGITITASEITLTESGKTYDATEITAATLVSYGTESSKTKYIDTAAIAAIKIKNAATYTITVSILDAYKDGVSFVNDSNVSIGTSVTLQYTVSKLTAKVAYGYTAANDVAVFSAEYNGQPHKLNVFFTDSSDTAIVSTLSTGTISALGTELLGGVSYALTSTLVVTNDFTNVNNFIVRFAPSGNIELAAGSESSATFAVTKLLLLSGGRTVKVTNNDGGALTFLNEVLAGKVTYGTTDISLIKDGALATTQVDIGAAYGIAANFVLCDLSIDKVVNVAGSYTLTLTLSDTENVGWSSSNSEAVQTVAFTVNKLVVRISFESNNKSNNVSSYEGTYGLSTYGVNSDELYNVTYSVTPVTSGLTVNSITDLITKEYIKVSTGLRYHETNFGIMPKDADTYELRVAVAGTFRDSVEISSASETAQRFIIKPQQLQSITIGSVQYSGKDIYAEILLNGSGGLFFNGQTLFSKSGDVYTARTDIDSMAYTVSVSAATPVPGNTFKKAGTYKIVFTSKGGNNVVWPSGSSTIEVDFTITKVTLNESQISVSHADYVPTGYKTADMVGAQINLGGNSAYVGLFEIVDATFIKAGTHIVTFKISDEHVGSVAWTDTNTASVTKSFVINEITVTDKFEDITLHGTYIDENTAVNLLNIGGQAAIVVTDVHGQAYTLKARTDDNAGRIYYDPQGVSGTLFYEIYSSNNIVNAGTYTITYAIKSDYSDSVSFVTTGGQKVKVLTKTFTVDKQVVTVSYPEGAVASSVASRFSGYTADYNGNAQYIIPKISDFAQAPAGITFRYEDVRYPGQQITDLSKIVNAGTYTVTVNLGSNYTLAAGDTTALSKSFEIVKSELDETAISFSALEYNGNSNGLTLKVTYKDTVLELGYIASDGSTVTTLEHGYFTVTIGADKLTDGKIINAGTYSISFTITNSGNVSWTNITGATYNTTFDVGKIMLDSTLITKRADQIYSADSYTVKGENSIITGIGAGLSKYASYFDYPEIATESNPIKDAKTYKINFNIKPEHALSNVSWDGIEGRTFSLEFTIIPKTVTVQITAPNRTYALDGNYNADNRCSIAVYEVGGTQPLTDVDSKAEYYEAVSGKGVTGEPTVVGTYNVVYKLNSNYRVDDVDTLTETFTIDEFRIDEKNDIKIGALTYKDENLALDVSYRGTKLTIAYDSTVDTLTGANDYFTFKLNNNKLLNSEHAIEYAGTYEVTFTIKDTKNLAWANTNGSDYVTTFTVDTATNKFDVKSFEKEWGYGESNVPVIDLLFDDIYYLTYYEVLEVKDNGDVVLGIPERTVPTNYGTYRVYLTTIGTPNVKAIVADPTGNVGFVGQFMISTVKWDVPVLTYESTYTGSSLTISTSLPSSHFTLSSDDALSGVSFKTNSSKNIDCSVTGAGVYVINVRFIDPLNNDWNNKDLSDDSVQIVWTVNRAVNKINIVKSVGGVVDGTIVYGSTYSITASASDGQTPVIEYAEAGDGFEVDKTELYKWSTTKPVAPGNYVIKASRPQTDNYLAGVEYKEFTITKATLTARPTGSMTYGQMFADGTFSYTVTGYVNGETESVLKGTNSLVYGIKDISSTDSARLASGEYVLTLKGLSADNYDVVFVDGRFTVGKKPISVKVNDVTTQYTLDYEFGSRLVSGSELAEWDEVVGISILQITYITDATADGNGYIPAGSYAIRATGYSNKNYNVSFVDGILNVNPVELSFELEVTNGIYEDKLATASIAKIMKSDGTELDDGKLLNLIKSAVGITYSGNTNSGKLIEKSLNVPTEAGSYTANVVTRDSKNFTLAALSSSAQFIVEKKTIDETTISIDSKQYTGSPITVPTPNDSLYTSYYTVEVPSNVVDARDYSIVLRLLDSYNVQWKTVSGATCQIVFTVTPKPNAELPATPGSVVTPDLSIVSWTFGEYSAALNSPSIGVEYSTGMYFEYSDSENGVYTNKIPSDGAVGTYWVRAVIPASQNYQAYTSEAISFRIEPKIIAEPQLNLITSGENQNSVYTGDELTMRIAYNTALMRIITDEGVTVKPSADGAKISVINANTDGYKITFQLLSNNYVWEDNGQEDVVLVWKVARKLIIKPTEAAKDTFFVNGSVHEYAPTGFDASTMNIEGNVNAEGGKYVAIVTIKDTVNYDWIDGTQTEITFAWRVVGRGVIFGIVFGSLALIALIVAAVLIVRVVRHNNSRRLVNQLASLDVPEVNNTLEEMNVGAATPEPPKEKKPKKTTKKEPAADAAEKPATAKSSGSKSKSGSKSTKSDSGKGGAK